MIDLNQTYGSIYLQKKVTLFLMTEKGYYFLKAVYFQFSSIIHEVVTAADPQLSNDFHIEIINFCNIHKINCTIRDEFSSIKTEFCLAISWRWILNHPTDKLIILHDSLLPKYRGFSPLVSSLINGESKIGVSAIFGEMQYDTGSIIIQSSRSINYPITIQQAISLIIDVYIEVGFFILSIILNNKAFTSSQQSDIDASYSVWRDEDDYAVDWYKDSGFISRFVDSVGFPYKGASSRLISGETVRIFSAVSLPDINIENRNVGKVIFIESGFPIVICGKGLLKILSATITKNGETTQFIPVDKFRIRFL